LSNSLHPDQGGEFLHSFSRFLDPKGDWRGNHSEALVLEIIVSLLLHLGSLERFGYQQLLSLGGGIVGWSCPNYWGFGKQRVWAREPSSTPKPSLELSHKFVSSSSASNTSVTKSPREP
jgi:hypothetical protein